MGALRSVAWAAVVSIAAVAPLLTTNLTGLGIGTYSLTHDQTELVQAVWTVVAIWVAVAAWGAAEALAATETRGHASLLMLFGFLALACASAVLGANPAISVLGNWRSYSGLLSLVSFGALAFVAMQLSNPRRLRVLYRSGAVTGALAAAYGVVQVAGFDPANWSRGVGSRAFSTWGNPDFFGGYLLFPLAFALAIALADDDRAWRRAGGVLASVVAVGLVATMTRSAWIAAAVLVAAMGVAAARRGRALRGPVIAGGLLIVSAGVAFSVVSQGRLLQRATSLLSDGAIDARLAIWKAAGQRILTAPLLGTGPDMLEVIVQTGSRRVVSDDAHNYALELAATVGIPAALLLLGFFAWVLLVAARGVFSKGEDSTGLATAAAWAAMAAHLVHLMASPDLVVTTSLVFLCSGVLLGRAASAGRTSRDPGSMEMRRGGSGWRAVAPALSLCVGVAVVGVCVLVGGRGIAADHAFMQARIAARDGGDRVAHAERAVRLNPYYRRYAQELAEARGSP